MYSVTVMAPSFKTVVQRNIELRVVNRMALDRAHGCARGVRCWRGRRVLSREYVEMWLANLTAASETLREIFAKRPA
jgi:hypothetical protein